MVDPMMQGGQEAPPEQMSPEQAMAVLEQFGITPEDLPIVLQACQAAMAASEGPPTDQPQRSPLDAAIDSASAQHGMA